MDDDISSLSDLLDDLPDIETSGRGSLSNPLVIRDDADTILVAVIKQANIFAGCSYPEGISPRKKTYFKVVKQVLKDLPPRELDDEELPQTCSLLPQPTEEPTPIEVQGISPLAIDLLMRIFHNEERPAPRLPDVGEIWEAIAFLDRYAISSSTCNTWFNDYVTLWMAKHENELYFENSSGFRHATQLLFPCWFFRNKKFLMKISHDLVYNAIHPIREINPTDHRSLRLPRRSVNQLNHVKGRLKAVLMKDIWAIREAMRKLQPTCTCCKSTYFDHENSLIRSDVWPFELKLMKMSMNTCLEKLNSYRYQAPDTSCARCKDFPFQQKVEDAVKRTRRYFDGLCLRCMEWSLKWRGSDDDWDEISDRYEQIALCGVEHKTPTHFFSNIWDWDLD